jgi:hypothetical protein
MRKIEQQMTQAIRDGRNWHSGSTMVRQCPVVGDTETEVYLHGHLIAKRYSGGFDTAIGIPFQAVEHTLRNWPTRTTVSRLRALGIDAAIRKGKPTINGKEI